MIDASTSLADVAGCVTAALREIGYDPIVVGGSAATLHAPEAYRSRDVDMVLPGGVEDARSIVRALAVPGFSKENNYLVHSLNPVLVEFVPPPVAIAADLVQEFTEIRTAFGTVRVLRAVDAVCDRLNKYVVWSDEESFDVAAAVARCYDVDLTEVEVFVRRQAVGVFATPYLRGFDRFSEAVRPSVRRRSTFGFGTAVRVRLATGTVPERVPEIARRIRELSDRERSAVSGLDAVETEGLVEASGDFIAVTLSLRTVRDVRFVERLRIAIEVVALLRDRLASFPEIAEVADDDAPPIAASGAR